MSTNEGTQGTARTLLSVATQKGTVRHLVDVEATEALTLCGRHHGINPRNVFVGTWVEDVQSVGNATCRKCRTIAGQA